MAESKIVEAVAVAGGAGGSGPKGSIKLSKVIEEAMAKASAEATKEGITDPEKIRDRMMFAREEAKLWYAQNIQRAGENKEDGK